MGRNNRLLRLLAAILVLGAGLAALGAGVMQAWQQAGLSRTEAAVVRVDRIRGAYYIAVLEYRVDGQAFRIDGPKESQKSSYLVGERVTVAYAPDRPKAGHVLRFAERWYLVLLAAGFGLLALGGLSATWWFRRPAWFGRRRCGPRRAASKGRPAEGAEPASQVS
jgi:hypothetical protein